MRISRIPLIVVLFLSIFCSTAFSYDSNDLFQLYEKLHTPKLQIEKTYEIISDTIYHHDFIFIIDSGRIAFFEPVEINADSVVCGAYFQGKGKIYFLPSVQMERDQIQRFFHTVELAKEVKSTVLFFSPQIFDSLRNGLILSQKNFSRSDEKKMNKLIKKIHEDTDYLYTYELMRNLVDPYGRPYLFSYIKTKDNKELMYMYNSHLREEICLWLYFKQGVYSFMERVCKYSQYNADESYININGRDKKQIDLIHYDINSSISRNGVLTSKAIVKAKVLTGPTQLLEFNILPSLAIDSIKDKKGRDLFFKREKIDVTFRDWESNEIALFLNEECFYGDSLEITFYYQGEIAEKEVGEYFVYAGARWYPYYAWGDRATFDLTFKSDNQYTFISCGELIENENIGDTLITRWSVKPEVVNVSFNIGNFKKYRFEDDMIPPTEIYFSKDLHNSFGGRSGKNMQDQVAEDVMNSMKVFNHFFGTYKYPKITISEILANHGEAFPGFVHLGFFTWTYTDAWGVDRLFRAHEVAHQWWGVAVGSETYHDKWITEGFAEYSALMYYQAVAGQKKFLSKMKESRKDIFSVRNYLFSTGEESGPIAMGYRTSSTKTSGDYGLIIYKKGAFVLHMLRNMLIDFKTMSEDLFLKMMNEFYESNYGKNVTTQDFKELAEKYTGTDLDWFFDQWIYHNYLPEYKFSYDVIQNDSTKLYDVNCKIMTKGVPDNFKMYLPLEIQFDKKSKAYIRVFVDSNEYSFNIPGLSKKPKKIILNPFESVLAKVKQ